VRVHRLGDELQKSVSKYFRAPPPHNLLKTDNTNKSAGRSKQPLLLVFEMEKAEAIFADPLRVPDIFTITFRVWNVYSIDPVTNREAPSGP
jgi:hypothetical protein